MGEVRPLFRLSSPFIHAFLALDGTEIMPSGIPFRFSSSLPAPNTVLLMGLRARYVGIPDTRSIKRSKPWSILPPPVNMIPRRRMSPTSSGGVCSMTVQMESKIAVMGSSAGGHLAETVSTYRGPIDGEGVDEMDNVNPFPNAQILCYPVTDYDSHNGSYKNLLGNALTEAECNRLDPIKNVTADTPIAFLWHTETDTCVKVRGTLDYAVALHNAGVRCEMHVYPTGWHGMGLAAQEPCVARWADELLYWLTYNGYLG